MNGLYWWPFIALINKFLFLRQQFLLNSCLWYSGVTIFYDTFIKRMYALLNVLLEFVWSIRAQLGLKLWKCRIPRHLTISIISLILHPHNINTIIVLYFLNPLYILETSHTAIFIISKFGKIIILLFFEVAESVSWYWFFRLLLHFLMLKCI